MLFTDILGHLDINDTVMWSHNIISTINKNSKREFEPVLITWLFGSFLSVCPSLMMAHSFAFLGWMCFVQSSCEPRYIGTACCILQRVQHYPDLVCHMLWLRWLLNVWERFLTLLWSLHIAKSFFHWPLLCLSASGCLIQCLELDAKKSHDSSEIRL